MPTVYDPNQVLACSSGCKVWAGTSAISIFLGLSSEALLPAASRLLEGKRSSVSDDADNSGRLLSQLHYNFSFPDSSG